MPAPTTGMGHRGPLPAHLVAEHTRKGWRQHPHPGPELFIIFCLATGQHTCFVVPQSILSRQHCASGIPLRLSKGNGAPRSLAESRSNHAHPEAWPCPADSSVPREVPRCVLSGLGKGTWHCGSGGAA